MLHLLRLESVRPGRLTFGAAKKGAKNGGPPGGAAERGRGSRPKEARLTETRSLNQRMHYRPAARRSPGRIGKKPMNMQSLAIHNTVARSRQHTIRNQPGSANRSCRSLVVRARQRPGATRSKWATISTFTALGSPSQHGAARGDLLCKTSIARPPDLTRRTSEHHLDLDRATVVERAAALIPCSSAASVAFLRPVAVFPFPGGVFRTCFDFSPKSVSLCREVAQRGTTSRFAPPARRKKHALPCACTAVHECLPG